MSCIIVCPEPLAAQAGLEIFAKGGNVVDAAIAGAFTQGVVNPKACGIGGHAQIFIWLRRMSKPKWINFGPQAGSKAHENIFEYHIEDNSRLVKNNENRQGYKSIMIPSFVKEVYTAHRKWGELPWHELIAPSIKLARKGIMIYPYILYSNYWGLRDVKKLCFTKACADVYTKNGVPYSLGDLLIQEDYAKTLELVADEGPNVFYKGEIAEKIILDFDKHGGLVTEKDLKNCQPYEQDPLETSYKEYTIYENVPPTCGPIKNLSFNILENFELKNMGWLTPKYIHVISRAIQLATIEREKYLMADPKLYPEVWKDWKVLRTKEHALKIKDLILSNQKTPFTGRDLSSLYQDGTTHLATADEEGNICNLKHTIGSSAGVVTPGLGFMYNNHMLSFDPEPNKRNSVGPKKYGPIGGSPTTVSKEGKPVILSGSPLGAKGSTAEIQAIIGIIEFGMSPQQTVSVPRIHVDRRWATIVVEPNFPYPYPWRNLSQMGYTMEISADPGILSMIKIDPNTGELQGGTDPRGGGGLGKLIK